MLHLKDGLTVEDLNGYTILVPALSIVNASQLAMDILIASKKMKRIGQISHLALTPVYGPSPFHHCPKDRTASCEIYAVPEEKLLAVQFRTVMTFRHVVSFHKELGELLKKIQIKQVVILSNVMAGEEYRAEEKEPPLQYRATESFLSMHKQDFDDVSWKEYKGLEIWGGGSDIILYKAFEKQNLPVMIYYREIRKPEDSVKEVMVLKQVNSLLVDFLKICDKFSLTLPVSWHPEIPDENLEIMY